MSDFHIDWDAPRPPLPAAPPGYSHPQQAAADGYADPYGPIPGWICHRCAAVIAEPKRHDEWHDRTEPAP